MEVQEVIAILKLEVIAILKLEAHIS